MCVSTRETEITCVSESWLASSSLSWRTSALTIAALTQSISVAISLHNEISNLQGKKSLLDHGGSLTNSFRSRKWNQPKPRESKDNVQATEISHSVTTSFNPGFSLSACMIDGKASKEVAAKVLAMFGSDTDRQEVSVYNRDCRRICTLEQTKVNRIREEIVTYRKERELYSRNRNKQPYDCSERQEEFQSLRPQETVECSKESENSTSNCGFGRAGQFELELPIGSAKRRTMGDSLCKLPLRDQSLESVLVRSRDEEAKEWGRQLRIGHERFSGKVEPESSYIFAQRRQKGLCLDLALTAQTESKEGRSWVEDERMESRVVVELGIKRSIFPSQSGMLETKTRTANKLVDFMVAGRKRQQNCNGLEGERARIMQQEDEAEAGTPLMRPPQALIWEQETGEKTQLIAKACFPPCASLLSLQEATLVLTKLDKLEGNLGAGFHHACCKPNALVGSMQPLHLPPPQVPHRLERIENSATPIQDDAADLGIYTNPQGVISDSQLIGSDESTQASAVVVCCNGRLEDAHPEPLEEQTCIRGSIHEFSCRPEQGEVRSSRTETTENRKLPQKHCNASMEKRPNSSLDLLVDAVQVALAPIVESTQKACDKGQGESVAGKVAIFVHGDISIPQRKVSRQQRSTGKRKAQVLQIDHETLDAVADNRGKQLQAVPPDILMCKKLEGPSALTLKNRAMDGLTDSFIHSKRGRTRMLPLRLRDSILLPLKRGQAKAKGMRGVELLQFSCLEECD